MTSVSQSKRRQAPQAAALPLLRRTQFRVRGGNVGGSTPGWWRTASHACRETAAACRKQRRPPPRWRQRRGAAAGPALARLELRPLSLVAAALARRLRRLRQACARLRRHSRHSRQRVAGARRRRLLARRLRAAAQAAGGLSAACGHQPITRALLAQSSTEQAPSNTRPAPPSARSQLRRRACTARTSSARSPGAAAGWPWIRGPPGTLPPPQRRAAPPGRPRAAAWTAAAPGGLFRVKGCDYLGF